MSGAGGRDLGADTVCVRGSLSGQISSVAPGNRLCKHKGGLCVSNQTFLCCVSPLSDCANSALLGLCQLEKGLRRGSAPSPNKYYRGWWWCLEPGPVFPKEKNQLIWAKHVGTGPVEGCVVVLKPNDANLHRSGFVLFFLWFTLGVQAQFVCLI